MVRETPAGRAVLDRRTIHVADVQAEADEYPEGVSERGASVTVRSWPPLCSMWAKRSGRLLSGALTGPFTERQVDLLQTFADQAVIAIENVRCSRSCRRGKRVTEALDRQTGTAAILRVISQSQTDTEPSSRDRRQPSDSFEQVGGVVYRYDGGSSISWHSARWPAWVSRVHARAVTMADSREAGGRSRLQ